MKLAIPMTKKCKFCGNEFQTINTNLDHCYKQDCFDKSFWTEKITYVKKGDIAGHNQPIARIKGQHYILCNEDQPQGMYRGYGGRKFFIYFYDGIYEGKTLVTTNMFHNGTIPHKYRGDLMDNAVFVDHGATHIFKKGFVKEVKK